MKKKWMLLACLVFPTLGCREKPSPENLPPQPGEAAFVDAFLQLQFADEVSKGIPLVIQEKLSIRMLYMDESMSDFTAKLVREAKRQDKKLAEAVRDFCAKNSAERRISSIGKISVPHIVLTEQQMSDFFGPSEVRDKGWWESFYEKYPNSPGIIMLSRPGFSADGTIGVIYMGNQWGGLAGHGRIWVLEKKDGKWFQRKWLVGPTWIS